MSKPFLRPITASSHSVVVESGESGKSDVGHFHDVLLFPLDLKPLKGESPSNGG